MDLVCLGEILVDMFPAELGRKLADVSAFQPKPGGAPANVAVAAARLGARSAFIGKVGEDAFGHYLVQVLKDQGVETRGIRYDSEARTTLAFIAKPDENTAEFVFYRNPGADTRLCAEELERGLFEGTRAFHFGSLSLTDEPSRSATQAAVRIARSNGALVSFDVNYRPSLWPGQEAARARIMEMVPHVDLLKVNAGELALLAGRQELEQACRSLLNLGPALCVVTLGAQGSYFQTRKEAGQIPGFRVETVDATGCGDAFVAGLLTRLARLADWRSQISAETLAPALRYANAVGALTALTMGVIPALPTASQVEQFLAKSQA